MKDVDVKVTTEKKVVDAEEVKDKELVFVEAKPDSVRQCWKNLSFKKKIGLILGTIGAAAGASAAGYFAGRAITMASKAETAETLELPSDVIETSVSKDEVE